VKEKGVAMNGRNRLKRDQKGIKKQSTRKKLHPNGLPTSNKMRNKKFRLTNTQRKNGKEIHCTGKLARSLV